MEREYKYRGYHKATKTWVYGDLIQPTRGNVRAVILVSAACNGGWLMPLVRYAVDPLSVGQYIGRKDKNGVEIYGGDIVSYPESEHINKGDRAFDERPWAVEWDNKLGAYTLVGKDSLDMLYEVGADVLEIIGNIADNPELLNV